MYMIDLFIWFSYTVSYKFYNKIYVLQIDSKWRNAYPYVYTI